MCLRKRAGENSAINYLKQTTPVLEIIVLVLWVSEQTVVVCWLLLLAYLIGGKDSGGIKTGYLIAG